MSKEAPSELELFLQTQQSEGVSESSGEFTIARDKALQKLAEFQLPFEGAWAVKVFQSLIAMGLEQPLSVQLTSRVAIFRCKLPEQLTSRQLEDAYFNPEPSKHRELKHLTSALWAVGVNKKRGFQLSLPGEPVTLFWNGSSMSHVEQEVNSDFLLSVTHTAITTNWMMTPLAAAKANANTTKALSEYCYSSPVPLSVDGRRIDGLHHCPGHGWSGHTYPLTLFFADGDLPQIDWPSGTFDTLDDTKTKYIKDGCGLEGLTRKTLQSIPVTKRSGLASFITASTDDRDATWKIVPRRSKCYWIQDGAVVQSEFFSDQESGVNVGCYISAEDLSNDLTGFYLSNSLERTRRKVEAARLVQKPIRTMSSVAVEAIKKHNNARYHLLGNTCLLFAFGVGWTVPVVGIPIASLIGVFGLFARFATRTEEQSFLESLSKELRALTELWDEAVKDGQRKQRTLQKKKKRKRF